MLVYRLLYDMSVYLLACTMNHLPMEIFLVNWSSKYLIQMAVVKVNSILIVHYRKKYYSSHVKSYKEE